MGNFPNFEVCCCRVKQTNTKDPEQAAVEGKFERLAYWQNALDTCCDEFPIKETNIVEFHKRILSIGKPQFTLKEMKEKFKDLEGWNAEELWVPHSDFENLMENYLPMYPNQNFKEGPIHWISAMSLGLLWCQGTDQEKAEIMF